MRDGQGAFTTDGVEALGLLHAARVPVVLVSGRTRQQLAETGRLVGADEIVPELGALESGFPKPGGGTIASEIATTGIVDALISWTEGALQPFQRPGIVREASILLVGPSVPGMAEWVRAQSAGSLRLADNGTIRDDGVRAWHLLPAASGTGASVARVVARRELDASACLAVGNSREDLEMARSGVRTALVRNAVNADAALESEAPWITRGAYGSGVLEAVRALLGGA
ncbi:MAG: hypothetical protein HYX33_01925 [Actinobacteria bacterium]|nr:hypothetical protein [Actinomycetota bacterium]